MKNNVLTLGSLFDGIGAVPLAAAYFGIKPLWASEILPNAVSVTKRHFPEMEHLGDITKLNGGELPPVNIIAFGSPCQSFSVAGNRTGMEGKSGLFMEAIRIIREMREKTNGKYPEIVLFENVPGILSSGGAGRDYKTVLEAFTESEIPMPQSGRWANAGMVRGRGIDIAWVIKDSSKHFRVPQRRRRLFLVCDFTGQRAGQILFISQSLSGYFAARERERQGIAAYAESGVGSAGAGINAETAGTLDASYGKGPGMRGGIERDVILCAATGQSNAEILSDLSPTLNCNCEQPIVYMPDSPDVSAYGETGHGYWQDGVQTIRATGENHPSHPGHVVVSAFMAGQAKNARSIAYSETVSPTLKGSPSGLNQIPCVCEPQLARTLTARGDSSPCADRGQNIVAIHQNQQGEVRVSDVAYTLNTNANASGRNAPLVAVCDENADENNSLTPWDTQGSRVFTGNGVSPTLAGADGGGGRNPAGLVITKKQADEPLPACTMRLREGCDGGGKGPLIQIEKSGTLATGNDQYLFCAATTQVNAEILTELCPTITAAAGMSGNNKPYIVHPDVSGTLCASGAGLSRPAGMASETDLCVAYCLQGNMIGRKEENGPQGNGINEEVSFTLSAADRHAVAIPINTQIATRHKALGEGTGFGVGKDGDPAFTLQAAHCHAVAYAMTMGSYMAPVLDQTPTLMAGANKDRPFIAIEEEAGVAAVDCRNLKELDDMSGTLQAKNGAGYSLNYQNPVRTGYIVRRLTPAECERLMALPDGWTLYGHDGKLMSDSARYQMCGNSIVVNCLAYIMQNIAELLNN